MLELTCVVCSGRGRASVERAHDTVQLSALSGRTIVPGSLNLVSSVPVFLDTRAAVYRNRHWCYFAARLADRPVFINRWIGCPAHVFEIYSDRHLRSDLNLHDGSTINLCISEESVQQNTPGMKTMLTWLLCWRGREKWYYSQNTYHHLMTSTLRRRNWRASQQDAPIAQRASPGA